MNEISPFEAAYGVGILMMSYFFLRREFVMSLFLGVLMLFTVREASASASWGDVRLSLECWVSFVREAGVADLAYLSALLLLFATIGFIVLSSRFASSVNSAFDFFVSGVWDSLNSFGLRLAKFFNGKTVLKSQFFSPSALYDPRQMKLFAMMRDVPRENIEIEYDAHLDRVRILAKVSQDFFGENVVRNIEVVSGGFENVKELVKSVDGCEAFLEKAFAEA